MRFAFHGRVSTGDQQDPESSRNWQLATRQSPTADRTDGGEIVAEFFDIGLSRSLPWSRRPEAARGPASVSDLDLASEGGSDR